MALLWLRIAVSELALSRGSWRGLRRPSYLPHIELMMSCIASARCKSRFSGGWASHPVARGWLSVQNPHPDRALEACGSSHSMVRH